MIAINNPANIRFSKKNPWLGQYDKPYKGFCDFKTMFFGLRALAITLHTYFAKYRLFTVTNIINRYAPPSENNTPAYIAYVVAKCGSDVVNLQDVDYVYRLLKAICWYESNYYLSRYDFNNFKLFNFVIYGREKI